MLYIVGTSIGNIEDTSLRAVKTLTNCDIILAEDTASFDSYYKRIQVLFSIHPTKKQQTVHVHKENEFEKLPWIIDQLKSKKNVCLVSESGMPAISDPGYMIISQLIKADLPFTAIPGPTAFVTAAILSGQPSDHLLYLGFLPKKPSQVAQIFTKLKDITSKHIHPTVVFYESPHRINKTLESLAEILPDADISICRELTKKFEEIVRGNPSELKDREYKGELSVVVSSF